MKAGKGGLDTRSDGLKGGGGGVIGRHYHLFGHHDGSLYTEATVAVVEEILETRAEQVDDEDVM